MTKYIYRILKLHNHTTSHNNASNAPEAVVRATEDAEIYRQQLMVCLQEG